VHRDADGKARAWLSVYTSAVKIMGVLAPRLRLGPQSRMKQASAKLVTPRSVYDEMRSKPGWDIFE
jgi:hypothetical protein